MKLAWFAALVAAILVSGTAAADANKQTKGTFSYSETDPLILAAGESLYAAIGVSNTGWVFRAEGGCYV